MKLDYSEFIARHHKTAQPTSMSPPKKSDAEGLWIVFVLLLLSGLFAFMASISVMDEAVRWISGVAAVFSAGVGLFTYRWHSRGLKHRNELNLIHEVMEGSRGARLISDGSDNTVYFNQKFTRLCRGVGPPSLETLTRLFSNNEEGLAHFRLLADQANRGLTDTVELFSKYEDRERWLSVTAQPVSGYAGYVHWRIDDVTQKHTVDRAIRDEREKLIDFTDNAPVGFFSVDEQGRFVFANATFARWVGEDLRNLLDQGALHTYLSDPPKSGKPYDLIEDNRPRQVVEVKMKGAGGKTFLASINQIVVHEGDGRVRTRAVVHDLTTEREMRQALKASEDRFQRFFEEAPLGIIQINDEGMIADCNSAFASMLGVSILDVEDSLFKDYVHEADREKVIETMNKIQSSQETSAPLDIKLTGDDIEVSTQMYARKFRDGGNIVLHFIDVTEQKSLEAQFVQSQKMQAIGQLAGGIAHDFNNLLTAIVGFCDLLLLRHKPGDPSFGDIMQIKQNSNRAANLVRQLLAFSRQQTLRPKVQDITDILTEVSHLLRRLIGAQIELEFVHGSDLGLVKVDEGQMEQVLMNLAVNARDAIGSEAGTVTVETDNFVNAKPKELISEELPAGSWTVIRVKDTGCGIAPENLTRIFEPFFTTKEVGEGTGLGLATVYGIIRQTDGFLDVQSKVGEGTTFILYLPHASDAEIEDQAAEKEQEEDDNRDLTGTECILLVEDEDAVRTFSERALMNKGYEVLSADCGENALEVVEEHGSKPLDLLITDVVMPGIDGPTLAQRIRQNSPDLKIIFISGYTEDKLKDYMAPNTYFLPKPFSLKQLAAKVKEVLEE